MFDYVVLKDFQPFNNNWKVHIEGDKYRDTGEPKFIIDKSTSTPYLNETKGCIRFKCFLLTLGTPIVHTIAALVDIAHRIIKLVTFSHFWEEKEGWKPRDSFKERLEDAGKDLIKVITAPIVLVGLELSALYGILNPYDGRKLYASFERAQYDNHLLAPCFQPGVQYHFFGGDPEKRNAF